MTTPDQMRDLMDAESLLDPDEKRALLAPLEAGAAAMADEVLTDAEVDGLLLDGLDPDKVLSL